MKLFTLPNIYFGPSMVIETSFHRSSFLSKQKFLTLWELAYDIFIHRIWPKSSSFQLPYQHHSSSVDCTRELFKGSNR